MRQIEEDYYDDKYYDSYLDDYDDIKLKKLKTRHGRTQDLDYLKQLIDEWFDPSPHR